jgi:hypothetical protein
MINLKQALSTIALGAILPFTASAATPAPLSIIANITASATALYASIVGTVEPVIEQPVAKHVATAAPSPKAVLAAAKRPVEHELEVKVTPEVEKFVKYYTAGKGRVTTEKGLERSQELRPRAEEIFAEEGVPTKLVWLAQVESGWKHEAASPVGACGVWQFMPATAKDFGMEVSEHCDERMDFEKSTRASAKYLRRLAKRYDGNWELAIGAYNCGEGNMDKAVKKAGTDDFSTIVAMDLLPDETANYVPKVIAAGIIGSSPQSFGLDS